MNNGNTSLLLCVQERGAAAAVVGEGGENKVVMTGSDGSHKSTASTQLKDDTDFVMVELVSMTSVGERAKPCISS